MKNTRCATKCERQSKWKKQTKNGKLEKISFHRFIAFSGASAPCRSNRMNDFSQSFIAFNLTNTLFAVCISVFYFHLNIKFATSIWWILIKKKFHRVSSDRLHRRFVSTLSPVIHYYLSNVERIIIIYIRCFEQKINSINFISKNTKTRVFTFILRDPQEMNNKSCRICMWFGEQNDFMFPDRLLVCCYSRFVAVPHAFRYYIFVCIMFPRWKYGW